MNKSYKLSKNSHIYLDPIAHKSNILALLYQRNKKIVDNAAELFNKLSDRDIVQIVKNKDSYTPIPVSIFRSDLAPLESIVKYLKECLNFSFHKIASLLNRDDRTIYTTYSNCLKKKTQIVTKGEHTIPLILFSNRELSVLEVAASYLREELGMTLKEISILVNKDPRTIWTALSRAKKKLEKI